MTTEYDFKINITKYIIEPKFLVRGTLKDCALVTGTVGRQNLITLSILKYCL